MNCPHCAMPDFICLDCVKKELGISEWEMFKARVSLWWDQLKRKAWCHHRFVSQYGMTVYGSYFSGSVCINCGKVRKP